MADDAQGMVGQFLRSDAAQQLLGTAVSGAAKKFGGDRPSTPDTGDSDSGSSGKSGSGSGGKSRSGLRGLAAGAGAAALAPMAAKGIGKLIKGQGLSGLTEGLSGGPAQMAQGAASKLGDSLGDKVTGKVDEAGGPSGMLKDTVKGALPFGGGGGGGGGKGGVEGVGKGRRMPVQQTVDIAMPIENVYNQWTQFEDWPTFMHRVKRATQDEDTTVSFAVKIWGITREFQAEIETQRPNEVIKWKVSQGMTHTGLVAFHELEPRLTRIELGFDVDPAGLLEKFARGSRHVKRAARADLHRFKAFIEMLENETGAWRGVIEEGEVTEEHDPSYDEKREYGSADQLMPQSEDEGDESEEGGDSGRDGGDPEGSERGESRRSRSRQSSRSGQDSGEQEGRTRARSQQGSGSRGRSRQRQGNGGSSGSSSGSSSSSGRSSSSGSSRSSGRSSGSGSGSSRSSGRSSGSGSGSSRSSGRGGSSGRSRSSGGGSGGQGRQRTRSRSQG